MTRSCRRRPGRSNPCPIVLPPDDPRAAGAASCRPVARRRRRRCARAEKLRPVGVDADPEQQHGRGRDGRSHRHRGEDNPPSRLRASACDKGTADERRGNRSPTLPTAADPRTARPADLAIDSCAYEHSRSTVRRRGGRHDPAGRSRRAAALGRRRSARAAAVQCAQPDQGDRAGRDHGGDVDRRRRVAGRSGGGGQVLLVHLPHRHRSPSCCR